MNGRRSFGLVIIIVLLAVLIFTLSHKTMAPATQNQNGTTQTISTAPAGGNVKMTNMLFTPSQISVEKGATVTWNNDDKVAHTVVDDLKNVGGPASGNIAPGQTYSFTFTKSGSYQYHCSIHSSMRGTIVVK